MTLVTRLAHKWTLWGELNRATVKNRIKHYIEKASLRVQIWLHVIVALCFNTTTRCHNSTQQSLCPLTTKRLARISQSRSCMRCNKDNVCIFYKTMFFINNNSKLRRGTKPNKLFCGTSCQDGLKYRLSGCASAWKKPRMTEKIQKLPNISIHKLLSVNLSQGM